MASTIVYCEDILRDLEISRQQAQEGKRHDMAKALSKMGREHGFGYHKKIAQIARLENDWNGNGAGSFSSTLIDKISHLIDAMDYQPEVFPTSCNSIQFEYDSQDGRHLEIEISEQQDAEVFLVDQDGQEHLETIHSDDVSINRRVTDFIERHR